MDIDGVHARPLYSHLSLPPLISSSPNPSLVTLDQSIIFSKTGSLCGTVDKIVKISVTKLLMSR